MYFRCHDFFGGSFLISLFALSVPFFSHTMTASCSGPLFFFTRIFYKFISHTILPRMRANRKISSVVDRKSRGPSGLRCRMVFSDYRTSTWSAVVDRKSRGSNWLRCRLVFNDYRTCTLRAVVGPKSRGAERALAQSVFQRLPCSVRLPVKSHAGLASFGAAWRPALCTPSCDDNKQLR